MSISKQWIKNGVLNTLEHGVTRVADALSSLVLIWILSPEVFSTLALSQAFVAPSLFFFLSPETVLYRDFSQWRKEGFLAFQLRLSFFQRFSWLKAGLALLLSFVGASFFQASTTYVEGLSSLIWAFSVALGPQICGADREFLRICLRLKRLNLLTLYQKSSLLLGTLIFGIFFPGKIPVLACFAAFSTLSTALMAYVFSKEALLREKSDFQTVENEEKPTFLSSIGGALKGFSLWMHISGVIQSWILTLEVFVFGIFSFPAREIGLYASVLKLANLSMALPVALSNLFAVWIGRKEANQIEEWPRVVRFSLLLSVIIFAQAGVLILAGPFILEFLGHGRWSGLELKKMQGWLNGLLIATSVLVSSYLLQTWLWYRTKVVLFLFRVYLPWLAVSLVIFFQLAYLNGFEGAPLAKGTSALLLLSLLLVLALVKMKRVKGEKR